MVAPSGESNQHIRISGAFTSTYSIILNSRDGATFTVLATSELRVATPVPEQLSGRVLRNHV